MHKVYEIIHPACAINTSVIANMWKERTCSGIKLNKITWSKRLSLRVLGHENNNNIINEQRWKKMTQSSEHLM